MGLIFSAVFIVMLVILAIKEGWLKLVKIIGLWLGSILFLGIVMAILKLEPRSSLSIMLNLFISGVWCICLVLYNVREGYIGGN